MIAALVPNLMDRSRFGSGIVRFVDGAAEAASESLVLVDLDRCDDIASFGQLSGRTVGFCAHVDDKRMKAAVTAGFDDVLARSAFFRRLPHLLAEGGGSESG